MSAFEDARENVRSLRDALDVTIAASLTTLEESDRLRAQAARSFVGEMRGQLEEMLSEVRAAEDLLAARRDALIVEDVIA